MSHVQAFLRARPVWALFLPLFVVVAAGCPGGDRVASRAEAVIQEKSQESADFAVYGLTLAAGSEAPFARQWLLDSAASENFIIARAALRVLADDPPQEAAETLRMLFESKRGALKLQAGVGLARLGDEQALEWVREQVMSGAGSIVNAVTVVAEHGDEDRLRGLFGQRIASDEPSIRNEAYVILGEVRKPWATRLLLEGLDKEFGEGRVQAIVSLGRSQDPSIAPKIERFAGFQGLVFASLEALGALGNADSIPAVRKMITHDQELVRVYAGAALWRLGDEAAALEVLEPLVGDEDAKVRENLAVQLGAVEAPAAGRLLRQLAGDAEEAVRLEAIRSLRSAGTAGEGVFLEAIDDASYQVSTVALDALGRVGGEDSISAIQPLLGNSNPYVALSAAHAILAIKSRQTAG